MHQETIKDGRASVSLKVLIADEPERQPWDATRCAQLRKRLRRRQLDALGS